MYSVDDDQQDSLVVRDVAVAASRPAMKSPG